MGNRAKFTCVQVEPTLTDTASPQYTIKLQAVTSGSPENDSFFKWTPSAMILLQTVNESAAKQFEVGAEYFVDFTEANAEEGGRRRAVRS